MKKLMLIVSMTLATCVSTFADHQPKPCRVVNGAYDQYGRCSDSHPYAVMKERGRWLYIIGSCWNTRAAARKELKELQQDGVCYNPCGNDSCTD
jgi:hypothetical protein